MGAAEGVGENCGIYSGVNFDNKRIDERKKKACT
jgi:hypothetical protein